MSTSFSAADHAAMARALLLAERGAFTTRPNPMVGCVIVRDGETVGEGWHQRAGEAHAEVHALRAAGDKARGATAYVTLEPCAHHGRTPPCADALIAAGVARVVVALEDPFPAVSGEGIRRLRKAGIDVATGLMQDEARVLNRGFLARIRRGRPWVRVKLAMSLDGRTALSNGESKWITSEASRMDVQRWRARSGAVLSASGTVLADNPRLTVRLSDNGPVPAPVWRVIVDRALATPAGFHVLDGSNETLVLHDRRSVPDERFSRVECQAVPLRDGKPDLVATLRLLADRGINEVHVEAGPVFCGALFAQGLVDELLIYMAPLLLGSDARPLLQLPALSDMAQRWQLQLMDECRLGPDWRLRFHPQSTPDS